MDICRIWLGWNLLGDRFWWWFRDDPAQHLGVNSAELSHIREALKESIPPVHGPIPWKAALSNRGVLTLCGIMILGAFYTYLIYVWFPKYLQNARGVDNIRAGNLTSLVIAGSALGMLLGGWLGDRIGHWTRDTVTARRYLGMSCYLVAAAFLFIGARCDDSLWFSIFWGLSFLRCISRFPIGGCWRCPNVALMSDLFPV